MSPRPFRDPPTRRARRARPHLECLEDRCVPAITNFTQGLTADGAPAGIVHGPDGNLWFAEFAADRIGRITPAGVITEFLLPPGRGPLNLAVGDDDHIWFTENTGDRIGRINPLAGIDAAIQNSLIEFAVPGAGSAPHDITAGPDGALWFTQSGSDQIGRITTLGVVTNEFAVPGAVSGPAGITTGPDGNLWFTQSASGEIGRLTPAGVFTEFVVPVPPMNNISDPQDITTGPGGALFFTDFGRDQIGRITTAGAITQFNLPAGRGPQHIAAGIDGNLYFTEAAAGRIGRLTTSALLPGQPTSGSAPLLEINDNLLAASTTLGITNGPNGTVWFTQNAGNAISRLDPPIAQLTVTATGATVRVFDVNLGQVRQFDPYPGYQGPISVAVGDVTGDGTPDIITGASGAGAQAHVKVFEGQNGTELASFLAFDPGFRGGVIVAADHVAGGIKSDIIVAAGPGAGPHIKVIDINKVNQVLPNGQIADSALLASFFAFDPAFTSGVSIAGGDVTGDSRADILVGAGPGAGPHVKMIDATKLNQLLPNGQIADSALLTSFFAFDPRFSGGVSVATGDVNFTGGRDLIIGAGPGAGPHVKVVDGTKFTQVQPSGQIADAALLGSFFAFDPGFRGGVRVAADDITADGQAELFISTGAGTRPHVVAIDGSRLGEKQANGQIANTALLGSFFTTNGGFIGGAQIAADADHRDGPIFGPPGVTITNSRRDINDVFIFQSPVTATNTVMIMTVSPFSTATTPATFVEGVGYEFRIANRDVVNTTDDLTFRMTFGPADAAGVQDVVLRALPAVRFAGSGGVLAKGLTGQNIAVRGAGGGGTAQFRAAEQDDPFFFDAVGFGALLNNPTAVDGVVAGAFPRGTSPNGFGPGSTPNFDAPNFFGPAANTLALTLEIPSARLTTPTSNALGFWGRTDLFGVQLDRMGRPAINTALIPPLPRGSNFPIGGTADPNRQERRNAFNAAHPRDDRTLFASDMVSVLTAFYPAGRPGGVPNAAQASIVANLLLPDILVYDATSNAGFGSVVTIGGTAFLGNGRKLSDDIISTELAVLTDDDLPAGLGGGPNAPAIVTQNVRDDNGLNLTDGSLNPPSPRGTNPGAGTQRAARFPYIGSRNPTGVPGGNPPP